MKQFNFTKRYVFALSIIAFLSLLAFYNLSKLISLQSNDGTIVSISSKQSMLSQQIALYAIYYQMPNLKENIQKMEAAHTYLVSLKMPYKIEHLYFEQPVMLDKQVRDFLFHAKRFEENKDGRSLNYVLQNSQKLLKYLEMAETYHVDHMKHNTQNLKNLELLIFILTLLTLLFEALFIFRPANSTINKNTREIEKQKEFLSTIIQSSTNAIIAIDHFGKIKIFNDKAVEIFGYFKDEIIGHESLSKIISPEYLRFDKGKIKLLDREYNFVQHENEEIIGTHKSGKEFALRASFGKSGENEDEVIIASMQDISKEKLKDRLIYHQAKFSALGEMVAIIAHQWRQPLAQLSYNCMYIKKIIQDKQIAVEVSKNEDIIEFMSETITNFENFYKTGKETFFSPKESILMALKLTDSLLLTHKITISTQFLTEEKIFGNANYLSQVILSMVQNSINAFKESGIEREFELTITLSQKENSLIIEIIDNAGGIKVQPIYKIFEPFFKKDQHQSTGIGLYMAKLLIEDKFSGTIVVQNRDCGAHFSIKLPLKKYPH